ALLDALIRDVAAGEHEEHLVVLGVGGAGGLVLGALVRREVVFVVDRAETAAGEAPVGVGVLDHRVDHVPGVVAGRRPAGPDGPVAGGGLRAVADADVDVGGRDPGSVCRHERGGGAGGG